MFSWRQCIFASLTCLSNSEFQHRYGVKYMLIFDVFNNIFGTWKHATTMWWNKKLWAQSFKCVVDKLIYNLVLHGCCLFSNTCWVINDQSWKIVSKPSRCFCPKSLSKKCVFIWFKAVFIKINAWHITMLYMHPNRMCTAVILSYQALTFMKYSES